MPCIFCEIAAKRAPAKIVFQNDKVTAFRDLHPRAPTHILIIPNVHVESLQDLESDEHVAAAAECLRVVNELAKTEGLAGGYRLVTNTGPDAGQSVFHLHFHLLGGRHMTWPPG
ncbi:MAG: histidine triad nucleotide-binding protein [Anaerolineae bacterium]